MAPPSATERYVHSNNQGACPARAWSQVRRYLGTGTLLRNGQDEQMAKIYGRHIFHLILNIGNDRLSSPVDDTLTTPFLLRKYFPPGRSLPKKWYVKRVSFESMEKAWAKGSLFAKSLRRI